MKLASLADSDDPLFDSQIAVNLKSSFNTLRQAARRLRNGERIVNLSTRVISLRLETYGVYSATKAAVEAMTMVLAKELRGRSITVNAVAPGPTATALFLDGKSAELIERMSKANPLERLGTPQDISARCRSSSVPTVSGSTARCCAPTAAWSEQPACRHSFTSGVVPCRRPF